MQNSIVGSGCFSAKVQVVVMDESGPYIQDPTACAKVPTLPLNMRFPPDIVSTESSKKRPAREHLAQSENRLPWQHEQHEQVIR